MPKIFNLLLNSSKGFASVPVVVLLLVLVGVGVGLVLTQRSAIFTPKAYEEDSANIPSPTPGSSGSTTLSIKTMNQIGNDEEELKRIRPWHGNACPGGEGAQRNGESCPESSGLSCQSISVVGNDDPRSGSCLYNFDSRDYGELCYSNFECMGNTSIFGSSRTWPVVCAHSYDIEFNSVARDAKLASLGNSGRCYLYNQPLGAKCNFDFECRQWDADGSREVPAACVREYKEDSQSTLGICKRLI